MAGINRRNRVGPAAVVWISRSLIGHVVPWTIQRSIAPAQGYIPRTSGGETGCGQGIRRSPRQSRRLNPRQGQRRMTDDAPWTVVEQRRTGTRPGVHRNAMEHSIKETDIVGPTETVVARAIGARQVRTILIGSCASQIAGAVEE